MKRAVFVHFRCSCLPPAFFDHRRQHRCSDQGDGLAAACLPAPKPDGAFLAQDIGTLLAKALADSGMSHAAEGLAMVVRPAPEPVVGVFATGEPSELDAVQSAVRRLIAGWQRVRYVDYAGAEESARILAERLRATLGDEGIARAGFLAIPRGGLFVLGMLAYWLGLTPHQLRPPFPQNHPLVVVDDCVLTGARFGRLLPTLQEETIIFATLLSHPDLRTAIERAEPRVRHCLGAQDLVDWGPERLGAAYPAWQERWLRRLSPPRYWVGMIDLLCFPWSEIERPLWDEGAARVSRAPRVVPPRLCLGNRASMSQPAIPVQVQPAGHGLVRPSDAVLFGTLENRVFIGRLDTGQLLHLNHAGSVMWQGLSDGGSPATVADLVARTFEIDPEQAGADTEEFLRQMLGEGLLVTHDQPAEHT